MKPDCVGETGPSDKLIWTQIKDARANNPTDSKPVNWVGNQSFGLTSEHRVSLIWKFQRRAGVFETKTKEEKLSPRDGRQSDNEV